MTPVIESKEEQLDTETISEYIREPKVEKVEKAQKSQLRSYSQDILNSATEVMSVARAIKEAVIPVSTVAEGHSPVASERSPIKPDVLETLWPGVQQDFLHTAHIKRMPSYYLMLGFMGGAVLAMIFAWGFSIVSSLISNYGKSSAALMQTKTDAVQTSTSLSNTGVRTPLVATYEVKEGDTLAGIALQNYKHISPRLLDEICKANNLTDANVLVLGQKLTLPEYHY